MGSSVAVRFRVSTSALHLREALADAFLFALEDHALANDLSLQEQVIGSRFIAFAASSYAFSVSGDSHEWWTALSSDFAERMHAIDPSCDVKSEIDYPDYDEHRVAFDEERGDFVPIDAPHEGGRSHTVYFSFEAPGGRPTSTDMRMHERNLEKSLLLRVFTPRCFFGIEDGSGGALQFTWNGDADAYWMEVVVPSGVFGKVISTTDAKALLRALPAHFTPETIPGCVAA